MHHGEAWTAAGFKSTGKVASVKCCEFLKRPYAKKRLAELAARVLKKTDLTVGGRTVATFRGGRGIRTGDDIIVVGYPLQGLLTSEMNVTKGIVSALAGPGEEAFYESAVSASGIT